MSIEYSPAKVAEFHRRRRKAETAPAIAGPVTIRRADGTTETKPPYSNSEGRAVITKDAAEAYTKRCRKCGARGFIWRNLGTEASPRWWLVNQLGQIHHCYRRRR